ncbi:MAG TPA: hypothetical protein VJP02_21445 [Candidatus Sulfotelmatobacter sp.]|nr:hypothetical protein [Candidatus Sulfotelmatobacter sp.]
MSHTVARHFGRFAVFVLGLALLSASAFAQVTLSIGLTPGTDPNGEPSYTASVSSSGGTASNVIVTYTMPSSELPISPTLSGGCLFTPGSPHLTVVCSLGDIAASDPAKSVTVAVHPVDTAPQDVTATASAANASSTSAFVTSTITEVGLTEMAVTMNSTNPGKVGEPLVYNVTVTNIQDDDARNVFAILVPPKLTTFVSATKGCTHGALVTCKLGQMSPGTSKTVTITLLPTVSGWTQATAGIRLTTPDRDFTNNSAANSIWINP